ncbi:MAG: TIGR04219 family outer membrane beta-barrel protein [Nitrospirae bacterium]|nr:TIGR04219 family outer membrane beta-barrel protein [Nitrospirota bacterium]
MMRAFRKITGLIFLLSFLLTPQFASAIGFEVAAGIWNQDPSGDIRYKGETLSLGNELKYGSETRFFGRAKIDMPLLIPNIYIMATPMEFEGTGNKSASFTFGERTFTGNTNFTSSLQLDHYDIAFYYGLPFVKTATLNKLNVDAGLNVRFIDMKAEVKQGVVQESKSLTIPLPMVYVGAQFRPINKLSLEAELRGIALGSNHFYDLIGRVKYKAIEHVFIAAGYRYEDIKIDKSDVKANLTFSGPFAEAGVEF